MKAISRSEVHQPSPARLRGLELGRLERVEIALVGGRRRFGVGFRLIRQRRP
jgi:hypothetical protein